MSPSYGKFPRRGKKPTKAPPGEVEAIIPGTHSLEDLTRALQQLVSRLRQHNVFGAEKFRARLEPLDDGGLPLALPVGSEEEPQTIGTHIAIAGRHTLDQLSLEIQKEVARLDELGVASVRQFRAKCQPLDKNGAPVALWNAVGVVVGTINIPDLPVEAPYRAD